MNKTVEILVHVECLHTTCDFRRAMVWSFWRSFAALEVLGYFLLRVQWIQVILRVSQLLCAGFSICSVSFTRCQKLQNCLLSLCTRTDITCSKHTSFWVGNFSLPQVSALSFFPSCGAWAGAAPQRSLHCAWWWTAPSPFDTLVQVHHQAKDEGLCLRCAIMLCSAEAGCPNKVKERWAES